MESVNTKRGYVNVITRTKAGVDRSVIDTEKGLYLVKGTTADGTGVAADGDAEDFLERARSLIGKAPGEHDAASSCESFSVYLNKPYEENLVQLDASRPHNCAMCHTAMPK